MEKNNNNSNEIDVEHEVVIAQINLHEWMKLLQDIILMILGAIFVVLFFLSQDNPISDDALTYSVSTVVMIYAIINIVAGYLFYRNPFNSEVIEGAVTAGLSIVLFTNHTLLMSAFSLLVISVMFVLAAVCITHGVILILGKGVKKSIVKAVLFFVLAAILIAVAVTYLILKDQEIAEKLFMVTIGGVIFLVGVAGMVVTLIRHHNTKKAVRENKIITETTARKNEDSVGQRNVRILTLEELRKQKPEEDDDEDVIEEEPKKDKKDKKKEPSNEIVAVVSDNKEEK